MFGVLDRMNENFEFIQLIHNQQLFYYILIVIKVLWYETNLEKFALSVFEVIEAKGGQWVNQ